MKKTGFIAMIGAAVLAPTIIAASFAIAKDAKDALPRPEGPCDIYAKGGAPCAAAHSSTRALYASYDGPLYQVMRASDGKTLDIGVVKATANDPGGYADAAAQDEFCANTTCWVTVLYDQSPNANHLRQAPRGGFSGLAMGGFNNLPIADMAPVTLGGHKVYGIFITAGMGLRWNDAKGTAVDDQAEGQYWVISGHHYNTGCCFDYGNAETDSRDDGDGTMETTYFGNQPSWYYGSGPGPWIMTDQENNLVGCVNPDPNDKYCADLPSINWRFVTATADGEPHHWRSMGGDAQTGELITMYDGQRIQNDRNSYDPMRKQGAILLGNGGDNSNGSSGTFYEAAMTAPNTFPSVETNQAIQANIVAARYDVQRLAVSAADKIYEPAGVQTYAPGTTANSAVTFVNTTGAAINDLVISLELPRGWKSNVMNAVESSKKVGYSVAPGQTVVVNFSVTSGDKAFNGDMIAVAAYTGADGKAAKDIAVQKIRNVAPVKINEFRVADGDGNATNNFIELYNAGDKAVDISGWKLTSHAVHVPFFSDIEVPAGTQIAGKSYYVFGLSTSGLAVDAAKGDKTIYVRSVKGIKPGDEIEIGTGRNMEKRKVAKVNEPEAQAAPTGMMMRGAIAPGTPTTVWQPLPEGPVITIPAGSKNIPVTSTQHFKVGDKMAIGYGATYPAVSNTMEKYEVVTVTKVGKPGTQAYLSMDAKKGDKVIYVSSTENITAGDKIRLDIDSQGHGIEWVTVKKVGTPSVRNTLNGPLKPEEDKGTGLTLTKPLKYNHASNMPYSVNGTGISFEPATKHPHSSNEPVLALVYSIELEDALGNAHGIDDVVYDAKAVGAGFIADVPANQYYGGPVLDNHQGNITLRDANGNVVDVVNYGGLVDPWLSEGYHGGAGAGEDGSYAPAPSARGAFAWGYVNNPVNATPEISVGRIMDGVDTDDNKKDFSNQISVNICAPAPAGCTNIKVTSVPDIKRGQRIVIGAGSAREEAIAATIGTAGATTLTKDAAAGSTSIEVASSAGFVAGQEASIGGIRCMVEAVKPAPRRWGPANAGPRPNDVIVLSAPIKSAAKAGTEFCGTGIGLAYPLKHSHANGTAVINYAATPGAPNRY